ncbi:MAG: IS256 family transposase [Egibacteraceae bacterium]
MQLLREAEAGDIGFLREGVRALAQILMEVDAPAREHGPEQRTGYRDQDWETHVRTIELTIPKLRTGSRSHSVLHARWLAEKALCAVVAQSCAEGVSTRRIDDVAEAMGLQSISPHQINRICAELDEVVNAWRNRPLDTHPYVFVWVDTLAIKVREAGRIADSAVVVATAVNAEGQREIIGLDIGSAPGGPVDDLVWTAFLRGLTARGASGTRLVVSEARLGLKAAIPQGAVWQRCQTHLLRDLLTSVPRPAQPMVALLVKTIFAQERPQDIWAQLERVVTQLREADLADAAELLVEAAPDVLTYTAFPREVWKKIWSTNPQQRLHREIRRRIDVVEVFPDRDAVIRLVGAVLVEQHDEWAKARRYVSPQALHASRHAIINCPDVKEAHTQLLRNRAAAIKDEVERSLAAHSMGRGPGEPSRTAPGDSAFPHAVAPSEVTYHLKELPPSRAASPARNGTARQKPRTIRRGGRGNMAKRRRASLTGYIDDVMDDTKDFFDDIIDRARDVEEDTRNALSRAIESNDDDDDDDDDDKPSVKRVISPVTTVAGSAAGLASAGDMAKMVSAVADLTKTVNDLARLIAPLTGLTERLGGGLAGAGAGGLKLPGQP